MAIRTALRMSYEFQRCYSYAAMHSNPNPNRNPNPNPVATATTTVGSHAKDTTMWPRALSLEPVHRSGIAYVDIFRTANNYVQTNI